jgi:glycosyltransferase involved in cell wall biosynthesis
VTWTYLLRWYPTASETFVYREASALLALGHAVEVLPIGARESGHELPHWTRQIPMGSAVQVAAAAARAMRTQRVRDAVRHVDQHPRQIARALWAAEQLGERVHVHFAGEAAEWAWLAHQWTGVPYSVTVHANDLYKPRPSLVRVLQGARAVLTISAHNQSVLAGMGVDAHVVRCGVDPEAWPLCDPRRGGVVSVGRWVPKKGLDAAHAACERLGLSLTVVSDRAPEGVTLRSGGRAQVAQVLSEAAVFVLPCRVAPDGDRDGIPVALMEAMACGVPVITTDLPGLGELVDDAVGWVVSPDDPSALDQAVRHAMADPDERARRGRAGRARVQRAWTVQGQVQGLLSAWDAP